MATLAVERLIATSEQAFTWNSVAHIEDSIVSFQRQRPGCFVLGISGTNGKVRRSRAHDVFEVLGTHDSIDWSRVCVFLVDERWGAESDDDINAHLVRNSLLKAVASKGKRLPEAHFVHPNLTLGSLEACIEDYQQRLVALLEREAPDGPHLVTLGLGEDKSIASCFPGWYAAEPTRWMQSCGKTFGVLATETSVFEVPQRICVNLQVIRKAENVVLYLGVTGKPLFEEIRKTHENRMNKQQQKPKEERKAKVATASKMVYNDDGILMVHVEKAKKRNAGGGSFPGSPLEYIMKYTRLTVVQLNVDVENFHTFVLLGAAGDLARKKTFPALCGLHLGRCLPSNFAIIGCDDPTFHADVSNTDELWENRLRGYLEGLQGAGPGDLEEFRSRLHFQPLQLAAPESWRALNEKIRASAGGQKDNRIFYLALPSFLFGTAVANLKSECYSETGFVRVIAEKPFGRNLAEARELFEQTGKFLQEEEIYRIDHYLAKTLVLNLLALRFANREIGRLFHADSVANVRITFKEDIGVEGRAGYFNNYGIIRDIMQNHLMQVLALVAMEAPASLSPEDVRDEKVKVLKQMRAVDPNECVIGQYAGYQEDPDIQRINGEKGFASRCDTFALVVLWVDNERWSNVPFIMKAGKALESRSTIVRVQFKKPPPNSLFGEQPQNELVIRIQPDEKIYWKLLAKMPGLNQGTRDVQQTVLDLDVKRRMEVHHIPEAYEKLIFDTIGGQSHNFVRRDELEYSWKIFDPLLRHLEVDEERVPDTYAFGSRGPAKADELINDLGFRRYTITGVPGFAEDDCG